MTTQFKFTFLCSILFLFFSCDSPEPDRLFIFSLDSDANLTALQKDRQVLFDVAAENGWLADTINDAKRITEENLQHYAAVVFLHTSASTLNHFQLADLERYVQAGGNFVGIHSEKETTSLWPWTTNADSSQLIHTNFQQSDQQDFIQSFSTQLKSLLKNNARDYTRASTPRSPDEDRFVKVPLVDSVWVEPIEMSILPNLDIVVIQRRGELMHYDHETKKLTEAGKLDVFFQADNPEIHSEQGLVGLTLDPEFAANNFIYLFYYPTGKEVSRLSRFIFQNKKLNLESEKIILEFQSDRHICCHTGGAIAFGPDGLLYITTGDNTSPSHQKPDKTYPDGYGSVDNRPEYRDYDATRTSANTNSLQGKILRIKVKPDGSYEIPEGNLFPKGMEKTRPEIYVMGARNPYRISIDQKSGFVYWCDIGPDAEEGSDDWGPKGTDEINQTRAAGNFGWPYFSANNLPYRYFDFVKKERGDYHDPSAPINNSPLNTGLANLPEAKSAFIWYPYDESIEFPQMGTGTRNAMVGPVYHSSDYPEETRLPEAFNGKLFIYEWMRDFIKVVTLDSSGNYVGMEPFMSSTFFSHPIDMEIGPDGQLYILEYGQAWYTGNDDSGLYRIDYTEGNRKPKARLAANKTSGGVPLSVEFSAEASEDPDGGKLSYLWEFGDGTVEQGNTPSFTHTYQEVGDFQVFLTAIDEQGASARTGPIHIYAGNEAPEVAIQLEGNSQFYFPDRPLKYQLVVSDKEDGELSGEAIPEDQFALNLDFITVAKPVLGHKVFSEIELGEQLIMETGCASCHMVDKKSAGPSYLDIAKKYDDDDMTIDHLSTKIIKGGSGVWGKVAMSPHPNLRKESAELIVKYILSLDKEKPQLASLPASGSFLPGKRKQVNPKTVVLLKANFTDRGGPQAKALQTSTSLQLSYPKIEAEGTKSHQNIAKVIWQKEEIAKTTATEGWLAYAPCDFTGISKLKLRYGFPEGKASAYKLELYLDGPDGELIGELDIESQKTSNRFYNKEIELPELESRRLHQLYIKYKQLSPEEGGVLGLEGYYLE